MQHRRTAIHVICRMLLAILCPLSSIVAFAAEIPAQRLTTHGIVQLDGPWAFSIGDNPAWADGAFDESAWTSIDLRRPITEQGTDAYTGYAWYRLQLDPQQVAALSTVAGDRLMLLVNGNSVGQFAIYINGVPIAQTAGMAVPPAGYRSPPVTALLPSTKDPVTLAIRTWVPPNATVKRGVLSSVQLGSEADILASADAIKTRAWTSASLPDLLVSFLFLCVAILSGAIFFTQRSHAEYMWLTLLCLCIAVAESAGAAYALGQVTLTANHVVSLFGNACFMAVTLQFVLCFTATPASRAVRTAQIAFLLIPILGFTRAERLYTPIATAAEVTFCVLISLLLFRGWRKGVRDAGAMLAPFLLTALVDFADTVVGFGTETHWLPENFAHLHLSLGPLEFTGSSIVGLVFLTSLLAVIFYRFIRVSQDEQRSNAEIAAARSVQSMLIPTELPKSRNFMLESAYLPVNGVGGDFFQVLPLKDDSLLIVVGDVSGKGLQAAMNSSTLVGALRNELSFEPATVLEHLNRVLLGSGYGEMRHGSTDAGPSFATCLCARAHPDGTLVIANAGHLGPYRDGRELDVPPGLPLGVIPNVEYEQVAYMLQEGDRLVFLSDGVVEATNSEGELFGFERTQQVSNEPARYIAQTAKHFGQTDDITVVSLYMASCSVREREAILDPA